MVDAGIDAPMMSIDAPAQSTPQTLSQTTSGTPDGTSALACGATGYTAKASYYRVFPLSMYGITGAFNVTEVDFPVETATSGPKLKITVGTYSGTPGGQTLPGTITPVATATITPADTDTSESIPITAAIPAGSNLVVEVDQTNAGSSSNGIQFYMGMNTAGESAPGYISASDCSVTTPTSITQAAMTETDMVLTVTGST